MVPSNSAFALKPISTCPGGAGVAVADGEDEAPAEAVAEAVAFGAAVEDAAAVALAKAAGVAGPPAVSVIPLGLTLSLNACSAAVAACGSSVSLPAASRSPEVQASRNALEPLAASSGEGGSATTVRALGVFASSDEPGPTRLYAP